MIILGAEASLNAVRTDINVFFLSPKCNVDNSREPEADGKLVF